MSVARKHVRIALLGGFTVSVDGAVVSPRWRLRKAKTVVKLLALAPGHRVHRDVLVERLWPEAETAVGANNLHQALHAARRVVGTENLLLQDEVVVLGGEGEVAVDVDDFDVAAAKAAATGRAEDIREALGRWSGELLPEDLYEDWAAPHRDRLNSTRRRLEGDLARLLIDAKQPEQALALLEPLVVERPLDEDVLSSLLIALAATGRRGDAAAAFERLREGLAESLGVAPARETTAVYRRLFVGGAPDPGTRLHNLPTLSTSFVGRHRELGELGRLLDRTRLLTLTGPGGAGKTRLAVELAHGQLASSRWADGVWLVELAGVANGDDIPPAVGGALELPLEGNRPWIPALVDQLSNRTILLVVDNCEHVLDTVVPLATELLARCPDLVIVATSREPFGHPGEIAFRVPSLERASWFYEAVSFSEAMKSQTPGVGQAHLGSYGDAAGEWLDGARHYTLHVPAEPPAKLFWSVTIYDVATRCLIDNEQQRGDRGSRDPNLAVNDDGSVDLWFGPTPPGSGESNGVQTIPGKHWFSYFRLYGPLEPYFDHSWRLGDITPSDGDNA